MPRLRRASSGGGSILGHRAPGPVHLGRAGGRSWSEGDGNPSALGAEDHPVRLRGSRRLWACGAVGSASVWHTGGRRFETVQVHGGSTAGTASRVAVCDGSPAVSDVAQQRPAVLLHLVLVAQRREHQTTNLGAGGSNPSGDTQGAVRAGPRSWGADSSPDADDVGAPRRHRRVREVRRPAPTGLARTDRSPPSPSKLRW